MRGARDPPLRSGCHISSSSAALSLLQSAERSAENAPDKCGWPCLALAGGCGHSRVALGPTQSPLPSPASQVLGLHPACCPPGCQVRCPLLSNLSELSQPGEDLVLPFKAHSPTHLPRVTLPGRKWVGTPHFCCPRGAALRVWDEADPATVTSKHRVLLFKSHQGKCGAGRHPAVLPGLQDLASCEGHARVAGTPKGRFPDEAAWARA